METKEIIELRQSTRERNESLWLSLNWAGLLDPVQDHEALRNLIHQASIEQRIITLDELWEVKETTQDKTAELELKAIAQDQHIADLKVALGYEKLAIYRATQEYLLAVKKFDAKVRDLIMAAREFAAQVALEQLELEGDKLQLEIDREVLRQQETQIKVQLETINRMMVEADVAKNKVEVAKAQVRALMAQIAAGEAEVQVIDAQAEIAMSTARKAELQARVAMIFADIVTRQLTKVRYEVQKEEIDDAFQWVQMKLTDMLAQWAEKKAIEFITQKSAEQLMAEEPLLLAAKEAEEDLKLKEKNDDVEVFNYEKDHTHVVLNEEEVLRQGLVNEKILLQNERRVEAISRQDKETWIRLLVDEAHRWVAKNHIHLEAIEAKKILRISGI